MLSYVDPAREFLYIEYKIALIELAVVYPFFILPAFLMYAFIYLFCLIMFTCYILNSSKLLVKVDSIN